MNDQLITFETAVLGKEKGFDEPCWEAYGVYSQFGELKGNECLQTSFENEFGGTFDQQDYDRDTFYLAPTQSLLQKWLRDIHYLHIDIRTNMVSKEAYFITIMGTRKPFHTKVSSNEYFNTYEEALEFGLQEALKLI